MKRCRGGLVVKDHRLVYHPTLGWRVAKKKIGGLSTVGIVLRPKDVNSSVISRSLDLLTKPRSAEKLAAEIMPNLVNVDGSGTKSRLRETKFGSRLLSQKARPACPSELVPLRPWYPVHMPKGNPLVSTFTTLGLFTQVG